MVILLHTILELSVLVSNLCTLSLCENDYSESDSVKQTVGLIFQGFVSAFLC